MIYIRGKRIDEDQESKHYKEYRKGLDEIAANKKLYEFQATNRIRWETNKDGKMVRARPQARRIPYKTDYDGDMVIYFDPSIHRFDTTLGGERVLRGAQGFIYEDMFYLDPKKAKDREFIYYIMHYSKYFKSGKVILVNREKDAKDLSEFERDKSAVHFSIYHPTSQISKEVTGSEDEMRRIARQWRVPGVDELTYHQLQHELWNYVQASEKNKRTTGRGYREFINDINIVKNDDIRAFMHLAAQRGVLIYDEINSCVKLIAKGGVETTIRNIERAKWADKEEEMFKFFLNDKRWFEILRESAEGSAYAPVADSPPTRYADMDFAQLRELAKERGIKLTKETGRGTKSTQDLIEDLSRDE